MKRLPPLIFVFSLILISCSAVSNLAPPGLQAASSQSSTPRVPITSQPAQALPQTVPASTQPISGISSSGHITFRTPDGNIFRLAAQQGAQPEDLGPALQTLAQGGANDWINISPNGAWFVLETARFDPACLSWACLAMVSSDLSKGEAINANGNTLHGGFAAVSSSGDRVVFEDGNGPHSQDLWVVNRNGGGWSVPLAITKDSVFAWNSQIAISGDGNKVVFDCGDQPYGGPGTAICEVGIDGSGFRVVYKPDQWPGGSLQNALHHPDYAPDGSIVFEADWNAEQIWRIRPGSQPTVIKTDFKNDNSPCVLPDGRIVSLWLERPGSTGVHEIKVMAPDGSSYFMAITGIDVADTGLGCGN